MQSESQKSRNFRITAWRTWYSDISPCRYFNYKRWIVILGGILTRSYVPVSGRLCAWSCFSENRDQNAHAQNVFRDTLSAYCWMTTRDVIQQQILLSCDYWRDVGNTLASHGNARTKTILPRYGQCEYPQFKNDGRSLWMTGSEECVICSISRISQQMSFISSAPSRNASLNVKGKASRRFNREFGETWTLSPRRRFWRHCASGKQNGRELLLLIDSTS
jgi:hypothetical protein